MLDDDPFAPRPQKRDSLSLDTMSIEELEARIGQLKDEIRACEAAISHKQAQRAKADALFRGDVS
jgi:uncharacterized small protein (DUF1192 family)